jgi:hypothetical protein
MSNAFAEDIEKTLKNNFPHVCHKIRIYNSTQSDNVKANDMKNILEIWSDLDCVISTPTIEAGVSYDCERFDRILGVISDGSCSQRSFFQMMARVRKIKNHEIVLLNLSRFRLNKVNPWNYDEVKQGLMLTEMVPLQKNKDNRYEVSPYHENYIHNKVEELNKQKYYFLDTFKRIAIRKGFQFIIEEKRYNQCPQDDSTVDDGHASESSTEISKETLYANIANATDVDRYQFEELKVKQRKCKLSRDEHYKLSKHYIKLLTGLDILTNDIVNTFRYNDLINSFACIFDDENEKSKDPIKHAENLMKLNYIRTIINKLGYSSIYDDVLVPRVVFQANMNDVIDYLIHEYNTNKQFNMIMNKTKHNIKYMKGKTLKALLGYINSFLSLYSLKISMCRRQEVKHANKTLYYKIELLNNIDELLEYRIQNGYQLKDKNNTFRRPSSTPAYTYKYKELRRQTTMSDDSIEDITDLYNDMIKKLHTLESHKIATDDQD